MKLVIDIGVVTTAALMMCGVGLALEWRMFHRLVSMPRQFGAGLVATVIVPVLVGLLVVRSLDCPVWLATGLLLISACPVGDIANSYTLLARGNPGFSLALHSLTCLLAPVLMAGAFAVFSLFGHDDPLFTAPGFPFVVRLLLWIGIPVMVGLAIKRRLPRWCPAVARFVHAATGVGIVFLLAAILVTQWDFVVREGLAVARGTIAFVLGCLAVSAVVARVLRLDSADQAALLACVPVRNLGVATLVAVTLLGRIEFAGVAAVYFLVEVPILALAGWLRRRVPRADAARLPDGGGMDNETC